MKSILPQFNAQRMVMDYVRRYYAPARKLNLVMTGNKFARAREVAGWRRKLDASWPRVRLRRLDEAQNEIRAGEPLVIRVAATLHDLAPDEVLVECLVGNESETGQFVKLDTHVFEPGERLDSGETLFALKLVPRLSGLQYYQIRMFPFHPALAHRYEAGYLLWL
jgi:starch phosphorylase